jgi:hypothetical protein
LGQFPQGLTYILLSFRHGLNLHFQGSNLHFTLVPAEERVSSGRGHTGATQMVLLVLVVLMAATGRGGQGRHGFR